MKYSSLVIWGRITYGVAQASVHTSQKTSSPLSIHKQCECSLWPLEQPGEISLLRYYSYRQKSLQLSEDSLTFPAFSNCFLSDAADPISNFVSMRPVIAISGMNANNTPVNLAPKKKAKIRPTPMLETFCRMSPTLDPVA